VADSPPPPENSGAPMPPPMAGEAPSNNPPPRESQVPRYSHASDNRPQVGTVRAQSLASGDLEDVKGLEAEAARLETLARELDSRADTLERRARELR